MRTPLAIANVATSAACLTMLCSSSFLQKILTLLVCLASIVTALHLQLPSPFLTLISFSTADLTVPAVTLLFSAPSTRDASIVQNRVSVNVEGVLLVEESVRTLSAWLVGGVRAASAYVVRGLDPANVMPGQFLISSSCSRTSFICRSVSWSFRR